MQRLKCRKAKKCKILHIKKQIILCLDSFYCRNYSSWFFISRHQRYLSGVAEATETTVSVQSAVEVVTVHVVVGQEIKDGDTLVELSRSDLVLRMNEVKRELDALEGRGSLSSATIDQKVAEVKADLATKKNMLLFEIEKLKSEYQKNLEMASKLKSLSSSVVAKADSNDAMKMRIRNLEQELKMVEDNANAQIGILRGSKGLQKTSSESEAEGLRRELELLKKEQDDLVITSKGIGWSRV
jgi:HlyD family secretion protein